MIINCRSCKRNVDVSVATVLWWEFKYKILFCLNCVPSDVRASMTAIAMRHRKRLNVVLGNAR